jgi:hypothetical protein
VTVCAAQRVDTPERLDLKRALSNGRCELCERRSEVQVHQVSKLSELAMSGRPQPVWAQLMTKMRRKTLMVCPSCHAGIHHRQPADTLTS